MTKRFCDRCGREVGYNESLYQLCFGRDNVRDDPCTYSTSIKENTGEVCLDCAKVIRLDNYHNWPEVR